ncbi:hypothetical protein [Clostridium thermosuccinogenes]|uniref:hypothetical protein n=1 Tax=Clostridium thermosuccinogenes TaxID=84032 RepID=UPI000CCC428B|nr:hypothetical protein [Pseudoclostridium thermosuccinogenes]PNT90897.1 hypothetical protein CDQ83_13735 [Pseudoclostridium thermosuccinogenes]
MNCEALFNSNKYKFLKIALIMLLSLIIIVSSVLNQYLEAYAFAPALVLAGWAIPEAVTIIGALLCAAGLTWAADKAIEKTVDWFVADVAPAIRDGLYDMVTSAKDGIARVSNEIWTETRNWIQDKFVQGEQVITKHYYSEELTVINGEETEKVYLPVNHDVPLNEMPVGLPQTFQIGSDVYEIVANNVAGIYTDVYYRKNGARPSDVMVATVNPSVPWCVYLESFDYYGETAYRFRLRYAPYGKYEYVDDINWPVLQNVKGNDIPADWDIPVVGQDVVLNPDWDIANENGERVIYVPQAVTDLVGDTYVDVTNPQEEEEEDPVNPPVGGELTGTWWQSLLNTLFGPIISILNGLWELFQDFWSKLLERLQTALSPLSQTLSDIFTNIGTQAMAIVNTITGVRDSVAESDITDRAKSYKLPDLFILILKVILACIRLLLRALIYMASIVTIEPNGSLLNSNVKSGINFLKNQKIPNLNITVWTMFSSMMTVLFSFAVVRRIKRMYSV